MADTHPYQASDPAPANDPPVPRERRLRPQERELVALRQKLESVNRNRAEFLSKLSHELRTPMTAIVGMTDLLLLSPVTLEQRECLGTVRDAADTLMALINEVCDYARVEAGLLDFEWSGFRLRTLTEDIVDRMCTDAREKDVEMLVRIPPEVPDLLVGDPRRIQQVLSHLIDSSLRLTNRGRITIDFSVTSELSDEIVLRVMVCDTGSGIAVEDQERILQPFLGSDSTLKKRYPLSPFGLPLVASMAASMGGQLRIVSELGHGSCFDMTLRLLKQNRSASLIEESTAANTMLRGRAALVVDGAAGSRALLTDQLSRWGLHAAEAADLTQAIEIMASEEQAGRSFDFVLLDAMLACGKDAKRRWNEAGGKQPLNLIMMYPADHEATGTAAGEPPTVRKPIFDYQLWEALVSSLQDANLQKANGKYDSQHECVQVEHRDAKSIARCEVEAAVGRLGGDVELYKELVQCFLDDTSDLIPKLRHAIEQRDPEGLHRAGHSLKGLAASCGAQGVAEAAGRIERVGREKQLEGLEPAWMALQRAMDATRQELADYYPG